MTLIILAIAWLLGILAADMFSLPLLPLGIIATICLLIAVVGGRVPRARLAALALCCAALGAARFDLAQVPVTPRSVQLLNDQGDLLLQGVIVDDPKLAEDVQRALIAAELVAVGGKTRPDEGLLLVKLPVYPERRYGDRLQLTGALATPREADRPGEFDYRQYLVRKRIFSLMEPKTVRLLGQNNGSPFWSGLLSLRDRARRVLLRELPEPQASLAVGILLGLQSSIPDDVSATFSATGTSHILVISGWNVTVTQSAAQMMR